MSVFGRLCTHRRSVHLCWSQVGRAGADPPFPVLVARAVAGERVNWIQIDPDLGWRDFSRNVIVHDIDSDHLHTLRPPHVRELADAMTDALSEVKAEGEVYTSCEDRNALVVR